MNNLKEPLQIIAFGKEYSATGVLFPDDRVKINKGSLISRNKKTIVVPTDENIRDNVVATKVDSNFCLKEDVYFDNRSLAAIVISGQQRSGNEFFKTTDDIKLCDYESANSIDIDKTIDSWITPRNPNQYDTYSAFRKLPEIDWKQSTNVQKGAIVYIYQSGDYKCITHKCLVTEVNKTIETIDDSEFVIDSTNYENYGRYMTLRLVNEINPGDLPMSELRNNGLKSNMQEPCKTPDTIIKFVEDYLKNKTKIKLNYVNPSTHKRYLDEDDAKDDKCEVEALINNVDSFKEDEFILPPSPAVKDGVMYWPRDSKLKAIALKKANFKCEVNCSHQTFKRKSNGLNYTEGHHLIPLQAQGDERFQQLGINLDCTENIVSLCSNCHNMLHYGKDNEEALRVLYEVRKEQLEKKGIVISFEELLEYYK